MPDDSSQGAGGEGDLFHQWLAHREGQGPPGHLRASTVPPKWAPKVVAPEVVAPQAVAAAPAARAPEAAVPPEQDAPSVTAPVADATVTREDLEVVQPVQQPVAEVPAAPEAPAPTSVPAKTAEPEAAEPPVRLTFRPRTRARTAVGIGALLAAGSAVVVTVVAFQDRDEASIGIAVTLWVLAAIIWAVHSGTSVTRLSVRGGQLQVLRQGVRTTIDLASSYTPVEVHGRPGKHGWMVVFRRHDMSPFVIDHSMVDPAEFMRVLRYYRPEIDAEGS